MKENEISNAVYKTKIEKLRKAYTEKIVLFLNNKYTKVFKIKDLKCNIDFSLLNYLQFF